MIIIAAPAPRITHVHAMPVRPPAPRPKAGQNIIEEPKAVEPVTQKESGFGAPKFKPQLEEVMQSKTPLKKIYA